MTANVRSSGLENAWNHNGSQQLCADLDDARFRLRGDASSEFRANPVALRIYGHQDGHSRQKSRQIADSGYRGLGRLGPVDVGDTVRKIY